MIFQPALPVPLKKPDLLRFALKHLPFLRGYYTLNCCSLDEFASIAAGEEVTITHRTEKLSATSAPDTLLSIQDFNTAKATATVTFKNHRDGYQYAFSVENTVSENDTVRAHDLAEQLRMELQSLCMNMGGITIRPG